MNNSHILYGVICLFKKVITFYKGTHGNLYIKNTCLYGQYVLKHNLFTLKACK